MTKYLRFRDLKARGIINNRVTLKRWIEREGFPPGINLGPNSVAWAASEVDAWVGKRPACRHRQIDAVERVVTRTVKRVTAELERMKRDIPPESVREAFDALMARCTTPKD